MSNSTLSNILAGVLICIGLLELVVGNGMVGAIFISTGILQYEIRRSYDG